MRTTMVVSDILRLLSEMPFLSRAELGTFVSSSVSGVYKAVERLDLAGLVASLPHTTEGQRHTQRFYLTADGVRETARLQEVDVDELLRTRPVSSQWHRLLLGRLDALASIYGIAEVIHLASSAMRLRIYRAGALDAAVTLLDGQVMGIMRWGPMSDRTAFTKRIERLHDGPMPGSLMLLVPDEIRSRYAVRFLARQHIPAFVAIERTFMSEDADEPVWNMPGTDARFDVASAVKKTLKEGRVLTEPPLNRVTMPEDLTLGGDKHNIPAHLLPVDLHPSDKSVLDMIADWPCISIENLRILLDLNSTWLSEILGRLGERGLLKRFYVGGIRLALTDRGLGLLARRDRASVGTTRRRWSISESGGDLSHMWYKVPGRRIRQLLRHIGHTDAVHSYLASMAVSARRQGWEIVQLDPPHRASRYFMHEGGQRSVHPDAFFMLGRDDESQAFFLEWERRAVRPSTMRERLAPYFRYYSTKRPLDDHGATPKVLVVLEDEIAVSHFNRIAEQEVTRTGVSLPLVVRDGDPGPLPGDSIIREQRRA